MSRGLGKIQKAVLEEIEKESEHRKSINAQSEWIPLQVLMGRIFESKGDNIGAVFYNHPIYKWGSLEYQRQYASLKRAVGRLTEMGLLKL